MILKVVGGGPPQPPVTAAGLPVAGAAVPAAARAAAMRAVAAGSPRTQSRNVSPGGADQSAESGSGTHITRASSAYAAQAARGSPFIRGGLVLPGSIRAQTCCLDDTHPVGFPSRSGEFAKAPTSTGPIACSSRHRCR